jgi:hypothetical protein
MSFTKSSVFAPLDPILISRTHSPHIQQRNADQQIISTDTGNPNDPWDPGLSVTRRQITTHAPTAPAPPPPSTPADGSHHTLTRHKDRGDFMHRASKGKRSEATGHGIASSDHVRSTNDEVRSDPPFIPRHASSGTPIQHPSTTQPAHPSGGHAASRATHIVRHPVCRCPLFFIPFKYFLIPPLPPDFLLVTRHD